jgi:thiamine biosynthesis protein ThiC
MIPSNSAAETIVKLRAQNSDIDLQILELAKAQSRNVDVIMSLETVAEWIEEPVEETVEPVAEVPVEEVPVEEAVEDVVEEAPATVEETPAELISEEEETTN